MESKNKSLFLKKEMIANLSGNDQKDVKGGTLTLTIPMETCGYWTNCNAGDTCYTCEGGTCPEISCYQDCYTHGQCETIGNGDCWSFVGGYGCSIEGYTCPTAYDWIGGC